MGGLGSGRHGGQFGRPKARTRVEKCYPLEAAVFRRDAIGVLDDQHYLTGILSSGESFCIDFTLATGQPSDQAVGYTLTLTYSVSGEFGTEDIDEPIAITTLPGIPQGERWLFVCPRCGDRRRKLYMPKSHTHFGCRGCYDLTYRSVQVNDAKAWERLVRLIREA